MSVLSSISDHVSEPVKHWLDVGSAIGLLATMFGWLPQIAALLTVVWFALRIVIGWQEYKLNRRKLRHD